MAGENHVNLPDDLDQLLRRTMGVEPSPAFLPRVRERIANEQPAWRWSWGTVAAAGAAGAAIVIAVSFSGPDDRRLPPPVSQAPVVRTAPPAPPVVERRVEPRAGPSPARTTVRTSHLEPRTRHASDMPPVVVDERQRAALRMVMQMVNQGRLTEEAFAKTVPLSLQPIEERVAGIAVAPVEVSPLTVGGVLQVGTEEKQPPRPAEAGVSRP